MEETLKYPVGSFILWCDEYFKVMENYSDYSGRVIDMAGDQNTNFYFNYGEEKAQLITDKEKLVELQDILEKNVKAVLFPFGELAPISISKGVIIPLTENDKLKDRELIRIIMKKPY